MILQLDTTMYLKLQRPDYTFSGNIITNVNLIDTNASIPL